jgi:hypothetical protein|tara:strand:- start:450 stop:974 length:525 start_codon:yes stop_codon:yes gene_type:complete
MYIPKHKLKVGGKVPGKLIDKITGRQFLGKYVQGPDKKYYKGTQITSKSEELILQKDKSAEEKALGISTVHVTPSSADYTKGTFIRYFVKDSRLNRVVEVDKPKYVEQRKSGKLYRRTLKIMWYITGDPEDQTIKGYVYPGLKKKNQDVIDKAEQILSGIGKQVLTDTSQFVKK